MKEDKPTYCMNDLKSVFTHYDPKLGRNVPTENKINKEESNNEKTKC